MALSTSAQRGLTQLQARFESFYRLEAGPSILPFVCTTRSGEREEILLEHSDEGLALRVQLPEECILAIAQGPTEDNFDAILEVVEGVSHFLYLCERARTELPTTRLELELQAEVDKFAYLATDGALMESGRAQPFRKQLHPLHNRLYEQVYYLHAATSVPGARYRMANQLAARLWSSLLCQNDHHPVLPTLRRFYRAGQMEKIFIAQTL